MNKKVVLPYFGNVKHNLATPDAFTEVEKAMNNFGQ